MAAAKPPCMGVHVAMRNHHLRDDSPTDAKRLVKGQCIATWQCSQCPDWMDETTYAEMPKSIDVWLVESVNDQPSQRSEKLTIAATLLDRKTVRCEMVGRYLSRQMAMSTGRSCRSLSFTATLQILGNLWLCSAVTGVDALLCELFVSHQILVRVGNRPGQSEPRANKRRPKILALLTEPRAVAKENLNTAA